MSNDRESAMLAGVCDGPVFDQWQACAFSAGVLQWSERERDGTIDPLRRMNKRLVPLEREFYEPSAEAVAPKLLGHWLLRCTASGICGGPIVEAEAYLSDDPACHAAPGLTARNQVMFGPPGHAYVYLIYGLHFCVNAVCRPRGIGEAVLIRAVEPVFGKQIMQGNRAVGKLRHLTDGPARLCRAMDIDRELDGVDLCDRRSGLFIARNPAVGAFLNERGPVIKTTRVGITKAALLPLRFYLQASPSVSGRG